MIQSFSYKKGFTLIEVIVYLALFAILMAGSLETAFNLFESGGHNAAKAMLAEEGSFVIAKIQWQLSGATAVTTPPLNASAGMLGVNKATGTATLDLSTLVGGRVTMSNVSFYHAAAVGTGLAPEAVGVRFTLSTRTEKGAMLSQEFFSTTSLRK